MAQSVAFKCTYNDGGLAAFVGFAGTCSKDNIARNIENGRIWCSNSRCDCRRYYEQGLKGRIPVDPCMESQLFRDWRFGAGSYHSGAKSGEHKRLENTAKGKFAILTTRFPDEDEEPARRIVGLFLIEDVINKHEVVALPKGRVRLPLEEAKQLYFWAYYKTSAISPSWRTGLFRYLKDGQVHRILADVAATVRNQSTRDTVNEMIHQAFGTQAAPPPSGCLRQRSLQRVRAVAVARKYGPGGEGEAHRKLKEWVAKHPDALGLHEVIGEGEVEYPFCCGDSADVVFRHKSGKWTAVEIETTTPFPAGAFQAIKYRALLCADKGFPLDSKHVEGILVAWSIPSKVREFCRKYGLLWKECQQP